MQLRSLLTPLGLAPPEPGLYGSLFFIHIPKTAGTAVVHALGGRFGKDETFPHVGVHHLTPQDYPSLRATYRFYSAHAGYEVAVELGHHLITVLRDPVDRILSLYNFWGTIPDAEAVMRPGNKIDPAVALAKSLSFEEFVMSDEPRLIGDLENGQTWQIAANNAVWSRKPFANWSDDAVIARAEAHLQSMEAFGVTEDLASFAKALDARLGIQLEIGHQNVTKSKRIRRDELSPEVEARLAYLTRLDRRLHDRIADGALKPNLRMIRARQVELGKRKIGVSEG